MTCHCTSPGFCETFQKMQGDRQFQICRGEILTPEQCAVYRENWARLRETGLPAAHAAAPTEGPGTELQKLIAKFGLSSTQCAGLCQEWINRMNAWGVAGCEEHRAEILAHLNQAYKSTANLSKLTAGLTAIASHLTAPFTAEPGLPLTLEGLLNEAIRSAAAAESLPPEPPQNVADAGHHQQQQ